MIYGGERQTQASWVRSVQSALAYRPEEIYLYPLYVRPGTGLGNREREWDDFRLAAYREGRSILLEEGYEQVSFRMFRHPNSMNSETSVETGYRCQEDGMVGLGCGARSYTRELHYGDRYGVAQGRVAELIGEYVGRTPQELNSVDYGFELDEEDQRRRYLILTLLQVEGVDRMAYAARFEQDVMIDFPELELLIASDLASASSARIQLSASGIERSDAIGPWLFSNKVRQLMEGYEWNET